MVGREALVPHRCATRVVMIDNGTARAITAMAQGQGLSGILCAGPG
jgi:hypothetical protein